MLEILTAPNPHLAQRSSAVSKIDKTVLAFIEDMKDALSRASDPIGVGLAANQVGKDLKIFIAKPTLKSNFFIFINPKVIQTSSKLETPKSKTKKLEGCLSLPNIWGEVARFPEINLEYLDEKGVKHNKKFRGFMATIIQHEMDHLDGILFTKRVLDQKGTLYHSEKDEKGEDIFEEIKI